MKRVVFISDLHCGHQCGLTPPHYNPHYPRGSPEYRFTLERRTIWKFYSETIASLKPIHTLVVNGDAVDGKGEKSGGTEQITTDRSKQADMAADAINEVEAENVVMTFGTPYHSGVDEDWEREVAVRVDNLRKLGSVEWISINDLVVQFRHFVSRSVIPHGRYTALAREYLWACEWARRKEYPLPDIIVRSHTHYAKDCGDPDWRAFITPALQGYHSKYGARQAMGTVDIGLLSLDIESKEGWSWKFHILRLDRRREALLKL